jgi:hypothetical protein
MNPAAESLPVESPLHGHSGASPLSATALRHFLSLVGLADHFRAGRLHARHGDVPGAEALARAGAVVIISDPSQATMSALGVSSTRIADGEWTAQYRLAPKSAFSRLRGFSGFQMFTGSALESIAEDAAGRAVWAWCQIGAGGVLLLGSDVVGDIVRFRQGDARRTARAGEAESWGYSGERPNYLFDGTVDKTKPHDRPADWLCLALADLVSRKIGVLPGPMLPNGARCALVVTGDTDGATSEHYRKQRELLGDLPITYFLRPACAAPQEILLQLERDSRVDLQLHPDALEQPQLYGRLLDEQSAWFFDAVGRRPVYVRNHGYLNDGYWRHARHWIRNGVTWSSNLPGVDGLVLNGSLLPARLCLNGELTSHWSLVTPYGDGMVFALALSDEQAAARVETHVDEIIASEVPGVLAVNLHPANVASTAALHSVIQRLADKGVLTWSVDQCARWFEQMDADYQ